MLDPIGLETLEIMQEAPNYNTRLFSLVKPWLGKRVLEVGAGTGTFISKMRNQNHIVSALDINPAYLASLKKNLPDIDTILMDLQTEKINAKLINRFDSVVMLNVLEHIPNYQKALENIYKLIKPGGRLIIVVPAHQWAYGTLDRHLGHVQRFSSRLLTTSLQKAGFNSQICRHISPLMIFGWWVNGVILKNKIIPKFQVKILDVFVPLLTIIDDFLNLPFGLSLYSVSQKPC